MRTFSPKRATLYSLLCALIWGCDDAIDEVPADRMGNHYDGNTGTRGTIHEICPHSGYNLLLLAIMNEREDEACKYIDMGSDLEHMDALGRSAIYHAAQMGQYKVVAKLIETGADVNSIMYMSGYSPLHVAAEHGHLEIVQLLLRSGATPNLKCNDINEEAVEDWTPAQVAERAGHSNVAHYIQQWIQEQKKAK